MKAKLVENIDFKRGQSSKEALDIGGFTIKEIHRDIFNPAIKKWAEFKESLIGKTIIAHVIVNNNTNSEGGKMTLKVVDVQMGTPKQPWIKVETPSGTWWDLDPNKKILINK